MYVTHITTVSLPDDGSSLILPASDLNAIAVTGALSGSLPSIATDRLAKWTLLTLVEVLYFSILLRLAT